MDYTNQLITISDQLSVVINVVVVIALGVGMVFGAMLLGHLRGR